MSKQLVSWDLSDGARLRVDTESNLLQYALAGNPQWKTVVTSLPNDDSPVVTARTPGVVDGTLYLHKDTTLYRWDVVYPNIELIVVPPTDIASTDFFNFQLIVDVPSDLDSPISLPVSFIFSKDATKFPEFKLGSRNIWNITYDAAKALYYVGNCYTEDRAAPGTGFGCTITAGNRTLAHDWEIVNQIFSPDASLGDWQRIISVATGGSLVNDIIHDSNTRINVVGGQLTACTIADHAGLHIESGNVSTTKVTGGTVTLEGTAASIAYSTLTCSFIAHGGTIRNSTIEQSAGETVTVDCAYGSGTPYITNCTLNGGTYSDAIISNSTIGDAARISGGTLSGIKGSTVHADLTHPTIIIDENTNIGVLKTSNVCDLVLSGGSVGLLSMYNSVDSPLDRISLTVEKPTTIASSGQFYVDTLLIYCPTGDPTSVRTLPLAFHVVNGAHIEKESGAILVIPSLSSAGDLEIVLHPETSRNYYLKINDLTLNGSSSCSNSVTLSGGTARLDLGTITLEKDVTSAQAYYASLTITTGVYTNIVTVTGGGVLTLNEKSNIATITGGTVVLNGSGSRVKNFEGGTIAVAGTQNIVSNINGGVALIAGEDTIVYDIEAGEVYLQEPADLGRVQGGTVYIYGAVCATSSRLYAVDISGGTILITDKDTPDAETDKLFQLRPFINSSFYLRVGANRKAKIKVYRDMLGPTDITQSTVTGTIEVCAGAVLDASDSDFDIRQISGINIVVADGGTILTME